MLMQHRDVDWRGEREERLDLKLGREDSRRFL